MPLYHRPNPLPLRPAHGVNFASHFPKPVPFGLKSAAVRRERGSRRIPAKPAEPVYFSTMLAGVAIGVTIFAGLALTLLLATLVWSSPYRTWYLGTFFLVYLVCTYSTTRELRRRLRASRPLEDVPRRLRPDGRILTHLLNSAQRDRMSRASDYSSQSVLRTFAP